eukprot:EG_transcript_63278
MGGRVSLEHVSTRLFLDCNGNNDYCALITHPFKHTRDQWFVLRPEGRAVHIEADHHPNRRACVLDNGAAHLRQKGPWTTFEMVEFSDEKGHTFTQFRCS